MDNKGLLSYGYLFKELPPPFNSIQLGQKHDSIIGLTFRTTKCIEFSIPKGQYSRRLLQLPHPGNFIQIVKSKPLIIPNRHLNFLGMVVLF